MNRFHIHLSVADLKANIAFYSALFGRQPTRQEDDYAKWSLDDPAVNFALSTRGSSTGVNHLGFQADDQAALEALRARAVSASQYVNDRVLNEAEVTCCYAQGNKYWITDPQGIAWEQFQTMGDATVFGGSGVACCDSEDGTACCG